MRGITKRLAALEERARVQSLDAQPPYLVGTDLVDLQAKADALAAAGYRVSIKGYMGVSPDDWPPARGADNG